MATVPTALIDAGLMSARCRLNCRGSESGRGVTPEDGTARGKIRKRSVYHNSLRAFGVVRIAFSLPQILLNLLRSLWAARRAVGFRLKRISCVTPRIESAA